MTIRVGRFLVAGMLLASPFAPGCAGKAPAQRYQLKGKVVEVAIREKQLVVEHEDIVGYMPAMTMPFPVKDDALLKVVALGDTVTATLVVEETRYWLEDLVIARKAAEGEQPSARAARPGVREGEPGEPVPDVALVNQDGKTFRLSDYHGRAVAITFIYTRCPLPDFCPLMTKNFALVAQALAADPALQARAHLLSISFDTAYDTPEVLRAYGRRFAGAGPRPFAHWEFATGAEAEVRRLGTFLGLEYDSDKGMWVHNLRTAVIGPDGKLVRATRGSDWKPDELVADLRAAAGRVSAR